MGEPSKDHKVVAVDLRRHDNRDKPEGIVNYRVALLIKGGIAEIECVGLFRFGITSGKGLLKRLKINSDVCYQGGFPFKERVVLLQSF